MAAAATVAFGQGNDGQRRREGEDAGTVGDGRKAVVVAETEPGREGRWRGWRTEEEKAVDSDSSSGNGRGRSQGPKRQRADGDTGALRDHGGKESLWTEVVEGEMNGGSRSQIWWVGEEETEKRGRIGGGAMDSNKRRKKEVGGEPLRTATSRRRKKTEAADDRKGRQGKGGGGRGNHGDGKKEKRG